MSVAICRPTARAGLHSLQRGRLPWAVVGAVLVAGCGGGGGAADTTTGTTETPQGTGTTIETLGSGSNVFHFKLGQSLADDSGLATAAGGSTYAAWNPTGDSKLLSAGLKIMFFGRASGCASTRNGTVDSGNDTDLATAATRSAISADSGSLRRWAPSGQSTGCSATAQTRTGPSLAFLNPDSSAGGLALYTHTGSRSDGSKGLIAPFDATGQNGSGTNAYISGTFAAFRQNWRSSSAITPWRNSTVSTKTAARIVSTQSVGSAVVGSALSDGTVVQAKQQISVSFINPQCMSEGTSQCQLNYLFNTAIYRAGVDDWSTVSWFKNGKVWFDAAQGGIPIIEASVKASGSSVVDGDSGLPLFVSRGDETQHQAFSTATFDVRISFVQLQNVLRIVTSRKLGIEPTAVTTAQLAADWGSQWNVRSSWVLLSSSVGQEVYNPTSSRKAVIGGSVKQLYVGPQG